MEENHESPQTSKQTNDDTDEIDALLNEMRKKGPILAHPMMYVSALHNKQGSYPVNQDDDFFKRNQIEFIKLPPKEENTVFAPPSVKYLISVDESGSFRHSLVTNK